MKTNIKNLIKKIFSIKTYTKNLTVTNIITALITSVSIISFKLSGSPDSILDFIIKDHKEIDTYVFSGLLAIPFRLVVKGIVEEIFQHEPVAAPQGDKNYQNDKDQTSINQVDLAINNILPANATTNSRNNTNISSNDQDNDKGKLFIKSYFALTNFTAFAIFTSFATFTSFGLMSLSIHIEWSYMLYIMSVLQIILALVTTLVEVAFITVAERKTMASMQRRLGPNIVGFFGILQAFADAVKLLLKEYISPTQANKILFLLGPVVTLIFSLLGYSVVPYAPGIMVSDFNLGILYMLAMSSLSTYGILLSGWSANSKYAFLGSLRSTAQLISYELILSSAILLVILFSGSLSLTVNIESQRAVWYILPLFPVFIIFFIGSVAETNRAPFDLVEAESELVSGYMTEHAAVVFVFFFLAEYASILLICILTSMLFIGGYLYLFDLNLYIDYISSLLHLTDDSCNTYVNMFFSGNPLLEGLKHSVTLGLKSSIMVFIFIWVRASYPRVRYDQLMSFCWTVLLPIIIAILIVFPCVLHNFKILPNNIFLL